MKSIFSLAFSLYVFSSTVFALDTDPCGPQNLPVDIGPRPNYYLQYDYADSLKSTIGRLECLDPQVKYDIRITAYKYGTETPVSNLSFDLFDPSFKTIGQVKTNSSGVVEVPTYVSGTNQGSDFPLMVIPLLFTSNRTQPVSELICAKSNIRDVPICGFQSQQAPDQQLEKAAKAAKKAQRNNKQKKNKNKSRM